MISEIKKHEDIYFAIEARDVPMAKKMMEERFIKLSNFVENIK